VRINANQVRGFVENFLWERFEDREPICDLHMRYWELACDPRRYVAFAAPREHSKTTSLPKARGLACAFYRQHAFQLKVSSTRDLALEIVRWCREEVTQNEKLIAAFRPKVVQDQVDDLIVEFPDGYQFRWVAMGMLQKVRGFVWGTRRPSLVDVDDAEDEFESLNPEIRDQVKKRLRRVILPMGSKQTEYRVYGTVVHQDSMLVSVLKHPQWKGVRLEACDERVSAESILWPDKFSQERLLELKAHFVSDGDLEGFNREYRNLAIDVSTSFFRPSDFVPMDEDDHERRKRYYVGGDLAFSKGERRDFTVLMLVGLDEDGILHFVEERRGRWDGNEVIDELYRLNEMALCLPGGENGVEEYFIESGAIKETLGAALEIRMAEEGYLNIRPGLVPTKDKAVRAVPLQARMRAKGCRWDTESSWFADHQQELLEFAQEGTRGAHDDRVDADAWVAQALRTLGKPLTDREEYREQLALARRLSRQRVNDPYEVMTGYEYHRSLLQ
jgi:predicted phage terminase large subunit-like protein